MEIYYIYSGLYFLLGILTVILLPKFIRNSYKDDSKLTPFWNGFMFGLYQCGCMLLFPVILIDYFRNKKK
jgi:hypothetical protein